MSDLYISTFEIKNYKKIESSKLNCLKINILLGGNNSGKSSVLSAIHFFFTSFFAFGSENNVTSNKSKDKDKDKFSYLLQEKDFLFLPTGVLSNITYSSLIKRSDNSNKNVKVGKSKPIIIKNNNKYGLSITRSSSSSYYFDTNYDTLCNYQTNSKNIIHSVYCPGLSGISYEEEYHNKAYIDKNSFTFGTTSNILRNILFLLSKKEEDFKQFNSDLIEIFGSEYNIQVPENGDEDIYIKILVNIKYKVSNEYFDKQIPLNQMGVGFLQILQILTYKHYYNPKVLLLDEPEVHLHASITKKLLTLLEKWVTDDTAPLQVFVSTHSRNVVEHTCNRIEKDNNDLYKIFHIQDGNICDCSIENIDNIMESDLGDSPIHIEKECKIVIITEDEKPIINSLIPKEYRSIIKVVPSKKSNLAATYNSIKKSNNDNKYYIFHADLDRKEDFEKTLKSILDDNNKTTLWFTDYATLEGYWLLYKNLTQLISNSHKSIDIDEIILSDEFFKCVVDEFMGPISKLKKDGYSSKKCIDDFEKELSESKSPEGRINILLNKSIDICNNGKETGIGNIIKLILKNILIKYFDKSEIKDFCDIDCPESLLKILKKHSK